MPKTPELSARKRILAEALIEFSRHGYSGARIDRITRRAKVNKRMLFYYFGNKQKLFHTVLESAWKEGRILDEAPYQPVESMRFWRDFYHRNQSWARLLLWEALERGDKSIIGEKARRAFWKRDLDKMNAHVGPGKWPEFLDMRYLLLTVVAVNIAPIALPQIGRLITGKDPRSRAFLTEHAAFVDAFTQFLADRAAPKK